MSLRKRFRQSPDPEQLNSVGTDLGDQNDDFNHVRNQFYLIRVSKYLNAF